MEDDYLWLQQSAKLRKLVILPIILCIKLYSCLRLAGLYATIDFFVLDLDFDVDGLKVRKKFDPSDAFNRS